MATLDWRMRDVLPQLGEKGRLTVLIDLLLRCDQLRWRCYPSVKKIAKDTGMSTSVVDAALDWLVATKALVKVGYRNRIGKEKALPNRQSVYQLTGMIEVNGECYPYLYLNPETRAIVDMLVRQSTSHISESEISESEISYSETEGITSIKGKPKKKQNSMPNGTGKAETPFVAMKNAIAAAFGYDDKTTTDATWKLIGKAASELLKAGATPQDMAGLHKYCASRFDNFKAMALATNWSEYQKTRRRAAAPVLPAPVEPIDQSTYIEVPDSFWEGIFK